MNITGLILYVLTVVIIIVGLVLYKAGKTIITRGLVLYIVIITIITIGLVLYAVEIVNDMLEIKQLKVILQPGHLMVYKMCLSLTCSPPHVF